MLSSLLVSCGSNTTFDIYAIKDSLYGSGIVKIDNVKIVFNKFEDQETGEYRVNTTENDQNITLKVPFVFKDSKSNFGELKTLDIKKNGEVPFRKTTVFVRDYYHRCKLNMRESMNNKLISILDKIEHKEQDGYYFCTGYGLSSEDSSWRFGRFSTKNKEYNWILIPSS